MGINALNSVLKSKYRAKVGVANFISSEDILNKNKHRIVSFLYYMSKTVPTKDATPQKVEHKITPKSEEHKLTPKVVEHNLTPKVSLNNQPLKNVPPKHLRTMSRYGVRIDKNFFARNSKERKSSSLVKLSAKEVIGLTTYDETKAITLIEELFSDKLVAANICSLIRQQEGDIVAHELKTLIKLLYYPRALFKILPPIEQKFMLKYFKVPNLCYEKRLFVKMMKALNWDDKIHYSLGIDLLIRYQNIEQHLGIEEAMELLTFSVPKLREIAVNTLARFPYRDLEIVMLQLVQSLRYESYIDIQQNKSKLGQFLIRLATESFPIANELMWYLTVEGENEPYSNSSKMYRNFQYQLLVTLRKSEKGTAFQDMLVRQQKLVEAFRKIYDQIRSMQLPMDSKVKSLQYLLRTPKPLGFSSWFEIFRDEFYLPLNPDRNIIGISHEKVKIFKSAMTPFLITFNTSTGPYMIIFKKGDDQRQDQMITQLIKFMDTALKHNQLDLCLSPYNVIATGKDTGFIECVPDSITIASLLKTYSGGILEFLRKHNPSSLKQSKYGVDENALNTYIKSCAGYCVITYILGIGDRHLDNLLITKDGHFFHIDFGFILGRDPKPFPAPMRICKEMIDGMGGYESAEFVQFKILCCKAFNILRKYANFILCMLNLMSDAKIPNFQKNSIRTVVERNFKLELNDEEASNYILQTINTSLNMIFPQIFEKIHEIAQSLKT